MQPRSLGVRTALQYNNAMNTGDATSPPPPPPPPLLLLLLLRLRCYYVITDVRASPFIRRHSVTLGSYNTAVRFHGRSCAEFRRV